jgi:hypothetical protein
MGRAAKGGAAAAPPADDRVVILRDALILPPLAPGTPVAAGVLAADGTWVAEAALWRGGTALTVAPSAPPPEAADHLPGRHLWGGLLWHHFGHFLVESAARLWPLGLPATGTRSVLFVPRRAAADPGLQAWQRGFFDLIDPSPEVAVLTRPTLVEELLVPTQGFGLGPLAAGTPAFRAFVARAFARGVAPEGPERLYLSRSGLGARRGGLLGEGRIEARLAAEGYEIFHPERHPLAVQVARYRAARQVVAPDGSALHLFGYAARPGQDVAMIYRRRSRVPRNIVAQLAGFAGIEVLEIQAVRRDVGAAGEGAARDSLGIASHAEIGAALARGGFIAPARPWPDLPERFVRRRLMSRLRALARRGRTRAAEGSAPPPAPAATAPAAAAPAPCRMRPPGGPGTPPAAGAAAAGAEGGALRAAGACPPGAPEASGAAAAAAASGDA